MTVASHGDDLGLGGERCRHEHGHDVLQPPGSDGLPREVSVRRHPGSGRRALVGGSCVRALPGLARLPKLRVAGLEPHRPLEYSCSIAALTRPSPSAAARPLPTVLRTARRTDSKNPGRSLA